MEKFFPKNKLESASLPMAYTTELAHLRESALTNKTKAAEQFLD
jgi:hypothetical protein